MVTITNVKETTKKDGTKFISLELSSSVELVQSQTTGRFYATLRRCLIPCTFSQDIAKLMIGQTIEGDIVRVPIPAYDFTNKLTGEVYQLQHSYAYRPVGAVDTIGQTQVEELQTA